MVLCVKCGKKRTTNSPSTVRAICWEDYQMCADCCIKLHPERYSLNIINQYLGKTINIKSYKAKNEDKICKLCSDTVFAKDYCKYHYYHIKREWKESKKT